MTSLPKNDFLEVLLSKGSDKKITSVTNKTTFSSEESLQVYIERFHSRDQQPYWFTKTKDDFCIKVELNSRWDGLVHQYGRRFFVLEHQYGRRDVI